MAFCKYCGKKLEEGKKCGCEESKAAKTTTSKKAEGFDFGKTMTSIKDDLLKCFKKPADVINDNVDAEDMPKTYITFGLLILTFGIFFSAIIKPYYKYYLDSLGAVGSIISAFMDEVKINYAAAIAYGAIIFAVVILLYAVAMLIAPALFKNKKVDFKKALTLSTAAYMPVIIANVIGAVLGFLSLDIRITLIAYLLVSVAVSYNFANVYAKLTNVKDNLFGYVIALIVLIGAVGGYATIKILDDNLGKSIIDTDSKSGNILDF